MSWNPLQPRKHALSYSLEVLVLNRTCIAPETNQFWLMEWSDSTEATPKDILCGFPSVKRGTKGVRSRKYVGKSRAPYDVIGLTKNRISECEFYVSRRRVQLTSMQVEGYPL